MTICSGGDDDRGRILVGRFLFRFRPTMRMRTRRFVRFRFRFRRVRDSPCRRRAR